MTNITELSQLDLTADYNYADYLTWQLNETIELIKGKIQLMAPAPNVKHQRLSAYISSHLFFYFEKKSCQMFSAPFDVRLYDRNKSLLANKEITTVVQPDICVICDETKLDEAVDKDIITFQEKRQIKKESKMTSLERLTHHLSFEETESLLKKATPEEKEELMAILKKKRGNLRGRSMTKERRAKIDELFKE